jgi:hypothetical protein
MMPSPETISVTVLLAALVAMCSPGPQAFLYTTYFVVTSVLIWLGSFIYKKTGFNVHTMSFQTLSVKKDESSEEPSPSSHNPQETHTQ